MNFNEALEKLKPYGQEHLLRFYEELDESERNMLLEEIEDLDLDFFKGLYDDLVVNKRKNIDSEFTNIPSVNFEKLSNEEKKELYDLGIEELKKGTVAVLLVAGGQGSRLGFDGPKGAYTLPLPSSKSLFEIQGQRILNIINRTGTDIPWYIMTSPGNHDDTVNFFKDRNFFGLNKDSVKFFNQEVFPSMDEKGKILLTSKFQISKNPNGSGGAFTSLKKSGYLDEMKDKGIKYLFFYGVDNLLSRICDPYFVGFAVKNDFDIVSKSVRKNSPSEKVGVFLYKNKKPSIVEYIEISEEMMSAVNKDGELLYGSGNILTHIFKMDYLDKALKGEPIYYDQHKKIGYINDKGEKVKPEYPNAHKFEGLYFDFFRYADDMAILDVVREEEFAPVKNAEGKDSALSSSKMYTDLCSSWLRNLGIEVKEDEVIEISPSLAIYGNELNKKEIEKKLNEARLLSRDGKIYIE